MQKILLVENIHPIAKVKLESEGFETKLISHSLNEEELISLCKDYDVLGIRSKTILSENFFKESPHLWCVGAFCIGTNQVDLDSAKLSGIPVFNAPYSNTRSVAELVIAEIIVLSRQLGDRNTLAHRGEWLKSADGSREVRGKVLGIVGYGHIGTQLSILAESLGLKVIFYDTVKKLPLGNAQPMPSLDDLLEQADFLSLHVPETLQTKNMISSEQLSKMKKGAFLINASRGTVVEISDLVTALKEKHIAGAAIDVFPMEPSSNKEKFTSPLQGLANVILTPHIGGSTEEAQVAIGIEVAESFSRFLKTGMTSGAVNFPNVDLPVHPNSHRILNVHRNESGVLSEINSIVSKCGGNIQAQLLSTDSQIGYMVMDVEKAEAQAIAREIANLSRSIKTRVVY